MSAPKSHARFSFLLCLLLLAFGAACGSDGDGGTTPCEEGDDACVEALDQVRLTYLDVQYDLSQPVYINNRVPIEYGLTGAGGDGAVSQVAVAFSFIEADPADPEAPIQCTSNAMIAELPGDGAEHRFNGYIWPTTACEELLGHEVNIAVEFDGGDEVETETDAPIVAFTTAAQGDAVNQQCLSALGEPGCVYAIDLQATPEAAGEDLIDVLHAGMQAGSSVGVLPLEAVAPTLSIESILTVNGRDPYIAAVDPADVPEDLIADEPGIVEDLQFGLSEAEAQALIGMPGAAALRYAIRPTGSEDEYLPLRVGLPDSETQERVDAIAVEELLPGTPNIFAHELYAEGNTRVALAEGGTWGALSDFEVRGCFEADFVQEGNEGSYDGTDDCRTVEIVMVRETESTTAATAHEFNANLERTIGGSRLRLETGLETQNRLDTEGVSSRIEGYVTIAGNIGRSFGVDVARASAEAGAGLDPLANGYEVSVVAFGETVFEASETGGEITREDEFSVAKSFRFPGLGFGFGPVRIGLTFELGGEVGIGMEDGLFSTTDADICTEALGQDSFLACAQIGRTTTPFFAFTGVIEGGVRIGPVSGGVEADLRLVNTEFPLQTTLSIGATEDGRVSVVGNANWNLELRLIQGDVNIVGRIRFRRRFLRRFNRTLRVNLFSFASPLIELELLNRSIALEELL